ncbi:MFS transporter [Peribacillus glennii]|uniref:MFS transporter n=1 Tax=Peribacillus glennii TaxID=2303991 RepID=A0A372LFF0_9BACI|nr:MFS transporter [Peribacillus glennii]RFU65053.1 MFS transporter [Peribacillus glennii]
MNQGQNDYIKERTPEFWKATISLSFGSFLVFSNLHFTQPLLPLISKEFTVSPAMASLTVSLVTLSLSIFLLIAGPLSDHVGRKNMMTWGLLLSSVFSILMFFVTDFRLLLFLRTMQGLALACLPAIAYAYIAEEFDKKAIGVAIGLYISGNTIGGMGGRILGGFTSDLWGWRSAFLTMGIIGMLCLLFFAFSLPKSRHFAASSLQLKEVYGHLSGHLKNRDLRDAYFLAGIIFFIFMGLFNYLAYHLHGAPYHLSSSVIGLLFLSYFAGTFSSTLSGKLDSVMDIPSRIFTGLLTMAAGILLTLCKPLFLILIGLVIICFGFFFVHAATTNWVSVHAKEAKGSASSLYLFFYYAGGSIGSFLLGFVWEHFGWYTINGICVFLLLVGLKINYNMQTARKKEKHKAFHI